MSALKLRLAQAARAFDACFDGEVDERVYTWLRVGLATLLVLRSTDFARGLVSLDHHDWVTGFDFSWSIAQKPYLVSPLLPGLLLGARTTWVLVRARLALALLLFLGIRPRSTAAALTVLNFALLFADRYRYFHHLQILYLAIAWLVLVPERAASADRDSALGGRLPAWPLQILRSLLIGMYLAAGSSKWTAEWWSGDSLAILSQVHQLRGSVWRAALSVAGFAGLAKLICLGELSLPLLLLLRATRRFGVVLGVVFHLLISCVMAVSIFGATMALLLASFWCQRQRPSE